MSHQHSAAAAAPPESLGGAPWSADQAETIIQQLKRQRGALLPILHALHDAFGYIDEQAVPMIAAALNLSRADVHGVVSFYHDFRRQRPGRRVVKICRTEACQARGADALARHAIQSLGVGVGETTPDGAVTLEAAFCLGNCALGPSAMVGNRLYGRVTAARFDALLEEGDAP